MAQGHFVGRPALSCGMIGARRLCGSAENTTGQENVSSSRSRRGDQWYATTRLRTTATGKQERIPTLASYQPNAERLGKSLSLACRHYKRHPLHDILERVSLFCIFAITNHNRHACFAATRPQPNKTTSYSDRALRDGFCRRPERRGRGPFRSLSLLDMGIVHLRDTPSDCFMDPLLHDRQVGGGANLGESDVLAIWYRCGHLGHHAHPSCSVRLEGSNGLGSCVACHDCGRIAPTTSVALLRGLHRRQAACGLNRAAGNITDTAK